MKFAIPLLSLGSLWLLLAGDPGSKDWPMWGGTPDRNMVSTMPGLPTSWELKSKKNVKWMDYYNRIPELSQCLRLSCLLWRLDLLEKRITKEDLNRRQWHRNWSHNVNVALN